MVGGNYWTEDEETSVFGAPLTHDGMLQVERMVFVDSLDDINSAQWLEMLASLDLDWAIVGTERSSGEPGGLGRS